MSQNIGYIERISEAGQPDKFKGEINLVGVISGPIGLRKVEQKRKPASPDYKVMTVFNRQWVEIGSAWYGPPKREPKGTKFFSMSLQSPTIPSTRITAFEADAAEQPDNWKKDDPAITFNVIWSAPMPSYSGQRQSGDILNNDQVPSF